MRKTFATVAILPALLALSGCGNSPGETVAATPPPFVPVIPVVTTPNPTTCTFDIDRTGFDLDAYLCSWLHQAMELQRGLDADTPLTKSWWPATHNSYNSFAYFNGPGSNADPNQSVTLTEQLWLDFMGVELDFHWVFSAQEGAFAPLMCHSTVNFNPITSTHEHPFCSPNDRHLRADLQEINAWLDLNPNRVIYVDLEANMQGTGIPEKDIVAAVLATELGSKVYMPPQNSGCTDMPVNLTRNQIRNAGKQVLLTAGCGAGDGAAWQNIVHGTGPRRQALHRDTNRHYTDAPDCGDTNLTADGDFNTPYAQYDQFWTRLWEDTTNVGIGAGNPGNMTADHLRYMARCTLNTPSLDQVSADDPRLDSLVWSWAPGEPGSDPTKNCAVNQADGFIRSEDCSSTYRFACNNSGTWQISAASGTWSQGATICANEGLGQFGITQTGADNEKLVMSKPTAGLEVWLDYSDMGAERDWLPNIQD